MAASSDANAPGGEPLWEALTDILEAERREKQALREEVDALTRELQEARALQLATYERLKSAENDAARAAYPAEGAGNDGGPSGWARLDDDAFATPAPSAPTTAAPTPALGSAFGSVARAPRYATPLQVRYDRDNKLRATSTPGIGTLQPAGAPAPGRIKPKAVAFAVPEGAGEPPLSSSAKAFFASSPKRPISPGPAAMVETAAAVAAGVATPPPHSRPTGTQVVPASHRSAPKTPTAQSLVTNWRDRCLTAEYRLRSLEGHAAELECDMVTMSLMLEGRRAHEHDLRLVERMQAQSLRRGTWSQYAARKASLLVSALGRQIADVVKLHANREFRESAAYAKVPTKAWHGLQKELRQMQDAICATFDVKRKEISLAFALEHLEQCFKRHDADGDGRLSMEEVRRLVRDLASPAVLMRPVVVVKPASGLAFRDEDVMKEDLGGLKLGDFYKRRVMPEHRRTHRFRKHFAPLDVATLNTLSSGRLKAVYRTYCAFGTGRGHGAGQAGPAGRVEQMEGPGGGFMDKNNFAKLCRECKIASELPQAEADVLYASVSSRLLFDTASAKGSPTKGGGGGAAKGHAHHIPFGAFLHALLMVAEEAEAPLVGVVRGVIAHGAPEVHVRTPHPHPPHLQTPHRKEVWDTITGAPPKLPKPSASPPAKQGKDKDAD